MIGQTLGSYRIVEQIGEGGMATIYKGYDAAMDRYVAVKILPAHFAKSPEFVERFKREAKAIARLEHPHIVPIHAYGEEEGTTYLIMRYMPTGTLSDRIKQGALPFDEAAQILDQIGSALDYAHMKGILHRDIKPSNILLDENGNAYLTDFGIAKMTEATVDLTSSGGILGTPAYMSPEQCLGAGQLTPATDQYALGIVAYEMVTGRTPFRAETPLAVINMHVNDPLPIPRNLRADLPERAEQAILKALAKSPEDRYRDCITFAAAFREAVDTSSYEETLPDVARPAPQTRTVPVDRRATAAPASTEEARITDATPAAPASTDPYALPAARPRKKGMSGWLIAGIVLGVLVIGLGLCSVFGLLGYIGLGGAGGQAATGGGGVTAAPDVGADQTATVVAMTLAAQTAAPPTEAVYTPEAATGGVLLTDDFSNMNSGWEIGDYADGSVYYEDGQYVVTSVVEDKMMWGLAGQQFSDVVVSVDATQIVAPSNDNNGYGLGCRIQDDDDGYYMRISGDGYYSIARVDEGEFNYLVDWTESRVINRGNALNSLQITCDGVALTFKVNGEVLATTEDNTYTSGDITLTATTFEAEMTEIHFDNLVVEEP